MKNYFILLVCFLGWAYAQGQTCRGQINTAGIVDAQFKLVDAHKFGKKSTFSLQSTNQTFYLIQLWGQPYQAGFSYGYLMKDQIKTMIKMFWQYAIDNIQQQFKFIQKLPKSLQPLGKRIALQIYKIGLQATFLATRPFTPKRFMQQIIGISQASGIQQSLLIQLNMIPQFTKAGCSILGAWGKATKEGHLLHLRALDWDWHSPFHNFPAIIVYNLFEGGSHPFANIGWPGFVGSITGFGNYIGVGEKVRHQTPANENETRWGKPWNYALRDVLQFASNIDDALEMLNKTHRTCSVHLGISSPTNQTFRLIEYSHKEFRAFDDQNFPYTDIHSQMDNVVDMPIHDEKDPCFNDLLKQQYGQIDAEWIMMNLAPRHKTGDSQLAVYDYASGLLYLQYAKDGQPAYFKPALRINLKKYLQTSH